MSEYPDKKSVQVYKDSHVQLLVDSLAAAERRVEANDPAVTDQMAHIAQSYLEQSETTDRRIEEARKVVARDHGMAPEELSDTALLKVTAGAYCGYQQTSDWTVTADD